MNHGLMMNSRFPEYLTLRIDQITLYMTIDFQRKLILVDERGNDPDMGFIFRQFYW